MKDCLVFWRSGWMRALKKRKYPDSVKSFGRAWSAGRRMLENGIPINDKHDETTPNALDSNATMPTKEKINE